MKPNSDSLKKDASVPNVTLARLTAQRLEMWGRKKSERRARLNRSAIHWLNSLDSGGKSVTEEDWGREPLPKALPAYPSLLTPW